MQIIYADSYKNSEKKLKRKHTEQAELEKIKKHIKSCYDFKELKHNEISYLYGFEKLKENLNGFYSFNLCKNRGQVRLLFSVNEELNQVCLEYISVKHYQDFRKKVR